MVRRTSFEGDACPIARSLEAIGDWWSLLIVRDAFDGLRRFGEFQKSLGLAKNIKLAKVTEPALPEAEDWVPATVPDTSTNAASD